MRHVGARASSLTYEKLSFWDCRHQRAPRHWRVNSPCRIAGLAVSSLAVDAAEFLAGCIRLLCGVRRLPAACLPAAPGIFFANHSSHLDFAVLWAALPGDERQRTRPVAGRDYWEATPLRRWIARRVFCAVLIERQNVNTANNPLALMLAALDAGHSLIVFPEGTRSTDGVMHDFKPGLFHLARARPALPLVPVYLENLNRMLPKGDILAVPLIASVTVGRPLHLGADENKLDFLARARQAVVALHADS